MEIDKLKKTCYLNGETYYINQKMYLIDRCYTCFCTEDFDNSTDISENSNCIMEYCFFELRHFGDFMRGCVPVFHKNLCCTVNIKCRKFL